MELTLKKSLPLGDSPATACVYYNGVIYVGGFFRHYAGQPRNGLAAIDAVTLELLPWDPNINIGFSSIESLYVHDGKIFVGGNGIIWVNGSITVSNLFAVDPVTAVYDATIGSPLVNGAVYSMVSDGALLYFCGSFSTVNSVPRANAGAIKLADGSLTVWDPSLNSSALAMDYHAALGQIFIAGNFSSVNTTATPVAVGYGASFDTGALALGTYQGWNPIANASLTAICVNTSTQSLYVGGSFSTIGPLTTARAKIAELDSSGTVLPFNPSAVTFPGMIRFSGGKVYIGTFGGPLGFGVGSYTVTSPNCFAVFNQDGSIDQNNRYDVNSPVLDIACFGDSSGAIPKSLFLCGFFTGILGSSYRAGLAKYTKRGSWVSSWKAECDDPEYVTAMAVDEVKRILYLTGTFSQLKGPNGVFNRTRLGAVDMDTGEILPWAPTINDCLDTFGGMALQDGVIYLANKFTSASGLNGTFTRNSAAAFDEDGNVLAWDPNLSGGSNPYALNLMLYGSSAYIAGSFTDVNNGTARKALAKFDLVNGTVDAWDAQINDTRGFFCQITALEKDTVTGKIYIGGLFSDAGGASGQDGLARLDEATAANDSWPVFPTKSPSIVQIFSMFKKDGVIRVFGDFTQVNATPMNRILVTDDAGTLLTGDYNPGAYSDSLVGFSDLWLAASGYYFFGLPGNPRSVGFSIFDYGNNLIVVDTGLDTGADALVAADDTYVFLGGRFKRTQSFFIVSGGAALFQAGVNAGTPRKPVVDYLLRKGDVTLFKWNPVAFDILGRSIDPDGYKIYRSNNENLETFELVATVTTQGIRGLVDTLFSEEIEGFYAYGVTAFNADGEGEMAVAEAVRSVSDADLF